MNKKSLRLFSAEVAMGVGSLFFVIPCLLLVLAAFKPDSEIVKFQGFLVNINRPMWKSLRGNKRTSLKYCSS